MPESENYARAVPSKRFDQALHGPLSHLADLIVRCVSRIACNPYEPELVRHCEVSDGVFAYHSPGGFELYWDVEVTPTTLAFPSGIRILLTDLRTLKGNPTFWLEPAEF